MAINPCCMELQRGVRILAIIDIVLDILNLISAALLLIAVTVLKDELDDDYDIKVGVWTSILYLIIAILGLLLSIRLLYGARNRDMKQCRIWLIVSIVITTINVITSVVTGTVGEFNTFSIITSSLWLVYRLYMMWVVYAFIQELKMDQQRPAFQSRLEGIQSGVAYPMQTYPQVYGGTSPPPPPGTYAYPQYPGGPSVVVHSVGQGQPQQGGLYNANNQYYTTQNV